MKTDALQTRQEEIAALPLASTRFDLDIDGLLARLTVRQRYVNQESNPIEAIFTFPMTMDATLLDLQVVRNERTLRGIVQARNMARERYEAGIDAGHTSILLEQGTADSYTANVGNLAPGESLELILSFGLLLRPRDGTLRVQIPTTIAPRYGASPLEPQAQPIASLLVQHRFQLGMTVRGKLTSARLSSPSHALRVEVTGDASPRRATIDDALLDRDVVLSFEGLPALEPMAFAAPDGDGTAIMMFVPSVVCTAITRLARDIVILVDCSGSMAGDSIRLVREALHDILPLLRETDRVELVRFGNTAHPYFGGLMLIDSKHREQISVQVDTLDADLGGTELGAAVLHALSVLGPAGERSRSLFVLTDGQVNGQDLELLAAQATRTGVSIHAVGIGVAAVESSIRALTQGSGVAEYVFPGESMRHRIARAFMRIGRPRLHELELSHTPPLTWSAVPAGASADEGLWMAARFTRGNGTDTELAIVKQTDNAPTRIRLTGKGSEGALDITIPVQQVNEAWLADLPRLAAALRLLESTQIADRAVFAARHQLVTKETACVLVDTSNSTGEAIPESRPVPSMLAAGWGGSGRVMLDSDPLHTSFFAARCLLRGKFDDAVPLSATEQIPDQLLGSTAYHFDETRHIGSDFSSSHILSICLSVARELGQQHRDVNTLRTVYLSRWRSEIMGMLPTTLTRALQEAGLDPQEESVALALLKYALQTVPGEASAANYIARWRDTRALKRVRNMLAQSSDQARMDVIKALIARHVAGTARVATSP